MKCVAYALFVAAIGSASGIVVMSVIWYYRHLPVLLAGLDPGIVALLEPTLVDVMLAELARSVFIASLIALAGVALLILAPEKDKSA